MHIVSAIPPIFWELIAKHLSVRQLIVLKNCQGMKKRTILLESIAATDFNFCVMFSHHPATLARNSMPHPLLVWVGRAHELIVFEIAVLCLTLVVHCSVQEAYSSFLSLDLWSRRPKLSTNQVGSWGSYGLGMVTAWKTAKKNRVLVPFLISYHSYYMNAWHCRVSLSELHILSESSGLLQGSCVDRRNHPTRK